MPEYMEPVKAKEDHNNHLNGTFVLENSSNFVFRNVTMWETIHIDPAVLNINKRHK